MARLIYPELLPQGPLTVFEQLTEIAKTERERDGQKAGQNRGVVFSEKR